MTSHLTKRVAAFAAVVLLAWVGARPARAKDYPGPYDQAAGQYYADEERHYQAQFGRYATLPSRDERPSYYMGYPGGEVRLRYAYGALVAPASGAAMSLAYSYGAYMPSTSNTAHIHLIVPADALVWFSDAPTRQTGSMRYFKSPELMPEKDYTYDVKVRWTENGREVTRTRRVGVSAGSSVTVDFTRP
jgi:uncharacterized protein (TIGR03000 family)